MGVPHLSKNASWQSGTVQHPLAKQRKSSAPIHHAFDEFELRNVPSV
jgi:hypothetical protein